MSRGLRVPAAVIAGCCAGAAHASRPATNTVVPTISTERLVTDLRHLTDVIGPRLTGSPAIGVASVWASDRFRATGLPTHVEYWTFAQPWTRGGISVRQTRPYVANVDALAWGWTPGTGGSRRGPVVALTARTKQEFASQFAGKLRGAWILPNPPATLPDRESRWPDTPHPITTSGPRPSEDELRDYQAGLRALLLAEGVAGILRDSAKPDALHNMATTDYPARPYPMPALSLSHEKYAQFWRLRVQGVAVELEALVENDFRGPIDQPNVIAEVPGTDRSAGEVIVAAHLDSWDLGTGANDNGAGVVATIEVARVLKAMPRRPRRTIRFALFTGEEQGSLGARAFLKRHASAHSRIAAVLVMDSGSGRIDGVSLEGRDDLRAAWGAAIAASGIADFTIHRQGEGDSDQLPFVACGIPAFEFTQADSGYERLHHAETDTLDHVDFAGLTDATRTLAALAWHFASTENRMPHIDHKANECL